MTESEKWIDNNADKASSRFTNDGITLWEESDVCEMMNKFALHIAEKSLGELRMKSDDFHAMGYEPQILSRIKQLTQ